MLSGGLRTKSITKQSQVGTPLITVVTVVRNGEKTLEETILSVINQTYTNVEYIIVDGASTDGTLDIIKKYEDKIDYWISEPDKGIYYAMNKGIDLATGEWINFMNSGDCFAAKDVMEKVFYLKNWNSVDIIYGNSIKIDKNGIQTEIIAGENPNALRNGPIYRHGASFVRASVHKAVKFDLSKIPKIDYALDFNCIVTLLKLNKFFKKVNVSILCYAEEGISNQPCKSLWYIFLIVTEGRRNKTKEFLKFLKQVFSIYKRKLFLYKII